MFDRFRDIARRIVGSQLFLFLLAAATYFYLYIYRLGTIVKGLSPAEATAALNSSSLRAIWYDPIYAPHKILQFGLTHVFGFSPTSLRLASAFFAGIFLLCFYFLCSRWFGRLIGAVTALMLAALPWSSLLGRSATPSIMLLIVSLILFSYYAFARSKKRVYIGWLLLCFGVGAALYIPGLIWILLAGCLINRRSLMFSVKRLSTLKIASGILLAGLVMTPLAISFFRSPALLHHWTLIPASWIGLSAFLKNLAWSVSALFVRFNQHQEWLVGRLPIFTVLISALAVFGSYAMSLQARQKLYAITALVAFGCLASAANGNFVYLGFCVIPLALLAAAGLRFLLLQWQAVFPRNPLPRYFAYGLIVLLAVGQLAYGIRSTLYAWPHTPETSQVFVLK